ncbi:1-phosphofructokinase family hexose kinase [Mobiluncus porci]|uniref:1-phosphofructokinase n=1 Tax=Mobiluncus porci TaxID=2652278 RepID=A0A7K0JZY0_9ACTO|nr:PfkB family carbohydrate kinase [Mobiluncus porci]MST48709.1 1-phosphofructokinase [Mobiluncus porci]
MPEIITFTPNPALDVTYQVPTINLNRTHRVETVFRRAGGKGLNTASVLAQMAFPARAVGFFTSQDFLADLEARHQELPQFTFQPLPSPFLNRSSVAIVAGGDATVFNEAGPSVGSRTPKEVAADWKIVWDNALELSWAPEGSIVTINGSFAPGTPEGILGRLVAGLKAKDCWVLVDTSGKYLLEAARAGADLLKPNVAEIKDATGLDDLPASARAVLRAGAKALLVSAGADGLAYIKMSHGAGLFDSFLEAHWAKPDTILSGNPTGAGDAAVAGFVAGLAEGLPLDEILTRAVAWSAAAVPVEIAGKIDAEMVVDLAANVSHKTEEWS